MKLSQNIRTEESRKIAHNDAFDTLLKRHSTSFGMLIGAGGSTNPSVNFSHALDTPDEKEWWEYREKGIAANLSRGGELISDGARRVKRIVSSVWRQSRNRAREKEVLRGLLIRPDHYLQDIGLERYQVEALLLDEGNLDDFVKGRQTVQVGKYGRLRLVARSRPENKPVHGIERAA